MCAAVEGGSRRREGALFLSAVVVMAAVVAAFSLASPGIVHPTGSDATVTPQGLSSFQSYSQLQQYIKANAKSAQTYSQYGVFLGGMPMAKGAVTFAPTATVQSATAAASSSPSFTGTNVQVKGVDEPDRVKTDGTHLFVSTQDSVSIINAYPPESATTLSTLSFHGAQVIGLEISQDRLAVIAGQWGYPSYPISLVSVNQENVPSSKVELLLYDTTDFTSPKLIQNVTIPGSYVAARLDGRYLYTVIQQPSYVFNPQGNATAVMPTSSVGGVMSKLPPTSVYYTPVAVQMSYYTIVSSVDMVTGQESVVSALTGPSANIYVSLSNIYVVYTNYFDLYYADGIPGNFYSGGVITPQIVAKSQNSTVLRLAYVNGTVTVEKAGVIPGTVLNQFSMDEYDGYFRVATSRFAAIGGMATTSDDVYVLDANMTQVSALRNIAPGENIYAVRFVGQMGYVVTFEQVDPLFVISFNDVSNPVILSALKVSGYSDYLHPLPGGYLIGVGKDAVPSSNGDFSYYLGLKLSLFRVFENGSSVQVAKMMIGDRGTDSPVLADHLAFTFDPTKNITVIPLTLYVVSGNQTTCPGCPPAYGDPVWQGAYVIRVTPSGFELLGKVSQYTQGLNYGNSPNNSLQIDRSVVIGDYLYTVSQGEVMVSALSSFATVATVQLPS